MSRGSAPCITSSKSGVVRIGFAGLGGIYIDVQYISGCLHCFLRIQNCLYQFHLLSVLASLVLINSACHAFDLWFAINYSNVRMYLTLFFIYFIIRRLIAGPESVNE